MKLPDLLPMRPYLREMVWGGQRLRSLYGKPLPAGAVGESFELSGYPERESVVADGVLEGRGLASVLAEYRDELVGGRVWRSCHGRFPLLVKLLDAQQDLSIQVHPSDGYARERGLPDQGKTEAWFVLHSDAGRVACGFHAGVGVRELAQAAADGRVEELVRFHAVSPGDVVFLPAGAVHALCAGVVIYEVQQASDLTFRVYDYGRPGVDGWPRELHLAQALEVADFSGAVPTPRSWRSFPGADSGEAIVADCAYFRLALHAVDAAGRRHVGSESFQSVTVVSGLATISAGGLSYLVSAGGTVLVPAGRAFAMLPDAGGDLTYLVATAGSEEEGLS